MIGFRLHSREREQEVEENLHYILIGFLLVLLGKQCGFCHGFGDRLCGKFPGCAKQRKRLLSVFGQPYGLLYFLPAWLYGAIHRGISIGKLRDI